MTLSVPLLKILVEVCDRFEEELVAGESPSIERYLEDHRKLPQLELLQALLATELEYRLRRDELASCDEYLHRFPDHADVVREQYERVRRQKREQQKLIQA